MAITSAPTTACIDCGSSAGIDNIWAAGGTIAAWVMNSSVSTRKWMASKGSWSASIVSGKWAFQHVWGGASYWPTWNGDAPTSGVWQHRALAFNSGSTANNAQWFVNGSSVATANVNAHDGTADTDAVSNFQVDGAAGASAGFEGGMEDFRAYKRVLSPNEIATLAAGFRGPLGGEVLWLPMDNPTAACTTGAANVFDLSGNGNHGTPQGGGAYEESRAPRSQGWIP